MAQSVPPTTVDPGAETLEELGERLQNLADNPFAPLVVLLLTAAILGIGMWYLRGHSGRAQKVRHAAEAAGCRYLAADPTVAGIKLRSFGRDAPMVSNVVVRPDDDGTDLKAFDYFLTSEATREQFYAGDEDRFGRLPRRTVTTRRPVGGRRTGGLARTSAYLPRLTVLPEGLGTRLLDTLGGDDLVLESGEFNDTFDVRTENRNFAHAFLDARMMDFMVRTGPNASFETFGHWLLVSLEGVAPGELPAVTRLVAEFKARVPDLVRADFPLPSARDAAAAPPAGFEPSHLDNPRP